MIPAILVVAVGCILSLGLEGNGYNDPALHWVVGFIGGVAAGVLLTKLRER